MCFNRKKIIEKAIHHTRRSVVYPDLTSLKSVGYLFSGEAIEQQSIWKRAGVTVEISSLTLLDGKRGVDTRSDVIYRTDLNLLRLPPVKILHDFIEIPFDILINMAGTFNDVSTYICAKSKAQFKVCYDTYDNLYDLVVDLNETHKYALSEEVIKTLSNLKSRG